MKAKLMEILRNPIYPHLDDDPIESLADYLLDNGVTIGGKWIPVSERLPDRSGEYLVCTKNDFYKTRKMAKAIFKKNSSGFYGQGGHWANVTHWMQLPEFPKEV